MCKSDAKQKRVKMPARPYSSSGAGSGVVLRHCAAAAVCACLTVDAAAAYCKPKNATQTRPADGFLNE